MDVKQRTLLAASVAGLLAAGVSLVGQPAHAAEEGETPCYGINKCKGMGECGGKDHSCAGQNGCQGQGYLTLKPDDCLKIQGGRLTAAPEPAA